VLGIICTEFSQTAYKCQCPTASTAVTVGITSTGFPGCIGDAPTPAEVVAVLSEDHLAAVLISRMPEILEITIQSRDDNSITLVVDSTVPFSELGLKFRNALADIIGDDVIDRVEIVVEDTSTVSKKRFYRTVVTATFIGNDGDGGAGTALNTLMALVMSASVILAQLF